ncbi:hypothetical protein ACTFIR_004876 [Dictyostelium discoideum]
MYARLYPFYRLSPNSIINPPLTQNYFNFTFSVGFETFIAFNIGSLVVETIIDEVYQINSIIEPEENSIHSKFVQLPPFANGPYTVILSTRPNFPNNTIYENFTETGPFFAGTYIVDNSANNFYLGIDLSPPIGGLITPPPLLRALSIFGKKWTKSMIVIPSEITHNDEISMITSYLGNDITNNIPSTLNISLAGPHQYKFYLYSYNSDWTDSIVNPIPSFTIKINGKYQEPITRPAPSYLTYKKYGPFYWNNINSAEQTLSIGWATDNIKYSIPLSGIEIYSSIQTPFSIPISN